MIATVLIVETKSLLIGEGARPELLAAIVGELEGGRSSGSSTSAPSTSGLEELLVAAKIALVAGVPLEEVAQAIDDAELRVRTKVPTAKLIYLEPDLDRGEQQSDTEAQEGR